MEVIYIKNKNIVLKVEGIENKIIKIEFVNKISEENSNEYMENVRKELLEYLEEKREVFTIEFFLEGTDFQKKVWKELIKIPYGEVVSYGEIAKKIGNPRASRAVGMACNKNKLPILVPCHRVVGKNGKLVGFASGLKVKKYLLNIENKKLIKLMS